MVGLSWQTRSRAQMNGKKPSEQQKSKQKAEMNSRYDTAFSMMMSFIDELDTWNDMGTLMALQMTY